MSSWNFADELQMCAAVRGADHDALAHGTSVLSWAELDRRAAGIAACLLHEDLGHQAKVAQYLYNCNEYLESAVGVMKAGMVPVNTNYRYGDDELVYLWQDADVEAIVFHGSFSERMARLRERLDRVRLFLHVDDGSGARPSFAMAYEQAASSVRPGDLSAIRPPWGRDGDDLYLLYTGGTTGAPKGVMWRQDDLFAVLNTANLFRLPEDGGLEAMRRSVETLGDGAPVLLLGCPLMHGTAAFTAWMCLMVGGCVVTMPERRLDPVAILETIERKQVNLLTIVGDSFAKPVLAVLDAEPGRFDLSSLVAIVSSGVIWSEPVKRSLLRHVPAAALVDAFSSSEALGMGTSVSTSGAEAPTALFRLGEHAKVIDDEGREVQAGSGQVGRVAVGGRLPLGYYKDDQKTASAFVTLGGSRYSVPGDYAMVEKDGSLRLMGRGSACINTGGEKVFGEEVDEVLKTHPAVQDAACVGVPDERFGESICALVQLLEGVHVTSEDLIAHVRASLAAFKAPRHVVEVGSLSRSPAGKLDYPALRALAARKVPAAVAPGRAGTACAPRAPELRGPPGRPGARGATVLGLRDKTQ